MSIEQKIQERKKQIMLLAEAKVRHAAFSLLSKIQAKSPVDTGEFRRAWTISEREPFHFVVSNDKPYAMVLEYGLYPQNPVKGKGKTQGGYSIQAPKGFARISIEEVKNEFK